MTTQCPKRGAKCFLPLALIGTGTNQETVRQVSLFTRKAERVHSIDAALQCHRQVQLP
jgi:hypothetical protein